MQKKMLEGKEILSIFHQFDATSVRQDKKKKYLKSEGEIEKFCILGALNSITLILLQFLYVLVDN